MRKIFLFQIIFMAFVQHGYAMIRAQSEEENSPYQKKSVVKKLGQGEYAKMSNFKKKRYALEGQREKLMWEPKKSERETDFWEKINNYTEEISKLDDLIRPGEEKKRDMRIAKIQKKIADLHEKVEKWEKKKTDSGVIGVRNIDSKIRPLKAEIKVLEDKIMTIENNYNNAIERQNKKKINEYLFYRKEMDEEQNPSVRKEPQEEEKEPA